MSATLAPAPIRETACPLPLENGERLNATEFLRRYDAMPSVKKAELIQGIVYMGSPVRYQQHARPDFLIQGWLAAYAFETPGVSGATNATVRLGPDDVPQPDALLRLPRERGGQSWVDDEGYLRGAPELAVEVAASSRSLDLGLKLQSYKRASVREYLVWRTLDRAVDWFAMEDDEFRPLPLSEDGTLRSRVFPGLWLHVEALLSDDGPRLMTALRQGMANAAQSGA